MNRLFPIGTGIASSTLPQRPTLERMYAVAAGLDDWNAEERAWISENPKWLDYAARLSSAIVAADRAKFTQLSPQTTYADHAFHV